MDLSAAALPIRLPRPEERDRPIVVLFDGHCRLCRGQVEKLAHWDTGERLAFLSLHDPAVAELYPQLAHDDLMEDMHAVGPDGEVTRGAAAWRTIAGAAVPLLPIWLLMSIPFTMPLWQAIYSLVARNRYWLFGRTDDCDDGACAVHFGKK